MFRSGCPWLRSVSGRDAENKKTRLCFWRLVFARWLLDQYFADFLRGSFDGDGTFYSYYDPRWRSSFMFYSEFISASKKHINWLRYKLKKKPGIWGHITKDGKGTAYQLKYAKADSLKLLPKMYYTTDVVCLSRKRRKIEKALAAIGKKL